MPVTRNSMTALRLGQLSRAGLLSTTGRLDDIALDKYAFGGALPTCSAAAARSDGNPPERTTGRPAARRRTCP